MRKPPPIGEKFGRLTVIGEVHVAGTRRGSRDSRYDWLCRCDCGNERTVQKRAVTSGHTVSCGCLGKSHLADWKRTHGMYKRRIYLNWATMLQRCGNPNNPHYPRYGGRGIRVCERWKTFENFYADMGDPPSRSHSIDRVNNDRGYSPDNCRWATRSQQLLNTRRSFAKQIRLAAPNFGDKRMSAENIRKTLVEIRRDRSKPRVVRSWATMLVQNMDDLKGQSSDQVLLAQFRHNASMFDRVKAGPIHIRAMAPAEIAAAFELGAGT